MAALLCCASMELPFSQPDFLAVFAAYNERIWPLQAVAAALGVMALALLGSERAWADRAIAGILAAFWSTMGVGYHWTFFSRINPAAYLFGGLFLAAAVVFTIEGIVRNRIHFRIRWNLRGQLASILFVYSLVVYPILGLMTHPYPDTPLFGVAPCPTTIFTLGLLVVASYPRPVLLAAVPMLWTVIGGSAAFLLDFPQDWGLPVAGLMWLIAWLRPRTSRKTRTAA